VNRLIFFPRLFATIRSTVWIGSEQRPRCDESHQERGDGNLARYSRVFLHFNSWRFKNLLDSPPRMFILNPDYQSAASKEQR
jgi:hypothetical protein